MQAEWEVHYSHEAATYLEDNGELISALFFAMEALAETKGVPSSGAVPLVDGRFVVELEGHLVLFSVYAVAQVIHISAIIPPEE